MRKKNFGNNLSGLLVFFKDSLHQNFIFLNSLFETQHKLTWTALFVDCNGAVPTNHMFLQSGYSWTSFKGKYFSRTKAVTPDLQSTQFRYDDRVITCQGYCILRQFWSSPRKKEIIWKEVRKNHLWTEGIQSSRGLTDICTPTWINLGPLDMSAANRVGSVSEISPRLATVFFAKILMCSYVKPGCPGYRHLGFRDGDRGNREKHFPIWTLPRGWPGRNLFWENSITFAS